jgi:hypothetical protein
MSKAAELANLIGNINAGGGGVNRNFIINGAMNVSQRGTSFSFSNNVYCLDRIMTSLGNNDGAATVTQDSSAPEGFANSLKVDVTTADSSLAVNHYNQMVYRIEAQNLQSLAFGTSDAKNITLSFYVKSNKTGTYSVNIAQNDNSYKQANLTYTIDSANTWERKSLTFTGDTSGVINNDNGHGLEIVWILAAGTTYSSGNNSASFVTYADANYAANQGVNVFDTVGNTWFLTGVQLEIGQNATEFEHEPFETTLLKCLRYFENNFPNTGVRNGNLGGWSHEQTQSTTHFKVKKRASPSIEYISYSTSISGATPWTTVNFQDSTSVDALRFNARYFSFNDYFYLGQVHFDCEL